MKRLVMLVAGVATLGVCGCMLFRGDGPVASVASPDGRNEIRLYLNPLSYEVLRDGRTMVAKSRLMLRVEGKRLGRDAETVKPVVSSGRLLGKVPTPVYKKGKVSQNGYEALVDFGKWAVRIVARDDGAAYRFETKFEDRIRVSGERADVTVPDAAAKCWAHFTDRVGCEETKCKSLRARDVKTDSDNNKIVYLPFVYSVSGKTVAVTESDVRDYPIWNLDEAESELGMTRLQARFAGWPKREYHSAGGTNRLERGGRWVRVEKHADWLVETEGTRTFPWRTFVLADAPAKLAEADIVYALAAPADKDADFSWVKPGKVAWDWWNDWEGKGVANCTTATYKRYIDFAAANGIEYVILDEGWSEKLDIWRFNPAVDVPEIIRHGREKGVGIILWMAWAQVVGEEEKVASHFAKLGAAGFKVDFMDRGDASLVRFLEKFAAVCAKEKMVVDYHGMYRPTGLQRRYPNILNYEGIHGLEQMKWNKGDPEILDNDVKAAFVRMTAGPLDYTPGAMENYAIGKYPKKAYSHPGSLGTRCRQMAMMALYEAPLQMLCDSPENYMRNGESLAFMAATPVTWDDTIGLAGDPDSFVVIARRKGDVWYVAGITNGDHRTYQLDTSFLGEGVWRMESFHDNWRTRNDAQAYDHETMRVRAGETIAFRMASGGGFIARFSK
ncbi:MAG: glycoside hydrolase family 97 catalytic domain-containing protein [Kiritimatiellae bacterium]|nr:glycoside hydrolase family 97 catalytic domain-containing protein [Kiritimatiellia bacterium]